MSACACVVLHDGRLIGWKINRERIGATGLSRAYFGPFDPFDPAVRVELRAFAGDDAWQCAEAWLASFPVHPWARERCDAGDLWLPTSDEVRP